MNQNRIVLIGIVLVGLLASAALHVRLNSLETEQLALLRNRIDDLSVEVKKISAHVEATEEPSTPAEEIRTLKAAKDAIGKHGKTPTATELAGALAMIDAWSFSPEEQKQSNDYKLKLASQLRSKVKAEVISLQQAALDASTARDGAKKHIEAGAVLALYPMSDDKAVVEEAKKLADQQGELAMRLEVLRRQRYNHWAAKRIEAAIDGYNKNKSYSSPKQENPKLMDSLVEALGEVDPAILEPVVLQLYNYVVDLTKASISETDKVDLAKRMSDPSIKRRILGDF